MTQIYHSTDKQTILLRFMKSENVLNEVTDFTKTYSYLMYLFFMTNFPF
jgi:hypothetical protein